MNISTVCVDANLVVRLFIDPQDSGIDELWREWQLAGTRFVAPALLLYEVVNTIQQYIRRGQHALSKALSLPIEYVQDQKIHQHALELANRFSLWATYDTHYLATADRYQADFWTVDRKLVRIVQHQLPWVHLVKNAGL